jgi:uncharacterized membrane protein
VTEDVALFFHLLGAFVLVAGIAVAGVAHAAARRRERPDEIALLLGLARAAVVLVAAGTAAVVVFGLWLVDVSDHGLDEPWLIAALALLAAALGLGAAGGRRPRQARVLATRLRDAGGHPTPELRRLLDDRPSAAANYLAAVAITAIIALMVWQPGA